MSATPASRPIASRHRLEVALLGEDLGDLADALDEDERAHLAKRVVQRVHDERKKTDALVTDVETSHSTKISGRRGRTGLSFMLTRHAAVLERRAHRLAHVDVRAALAPARLLALRLEPALELRDHAMHGREVLQRAGRQRAVELVQRPRRRQLLGALDLRALELAAQDLLEAADLVARQPLVARVLRRQVRLGLRPQPELAADPLDVDADDARALALAAERRDRQAREVAHLALLAVAQRLRDELAQRLHVDLGVDLVGVDPALLAHALAHGGQLGRAEEEPLEDELEDAPVVLGLRQRRGQRLAEVRRLGPLDLAQHREAVEQLARSHGHALGAQLLAELEDASGEAGLIRRRHRAARPVSRPPARPRCRGRCGA